MCTLECMHITHTHTLSFMPTVVVYTWNHSMWEVEASGRVRVILTA